MEIHDKTDDRFIHKLNEKYYIKFWLKIVIMYLYIQGQKQFFLQTINNPVL